MFLYIALTKSTQALTNSIGTNFQHICQASAAAIDEYLQVKKREVRVITQSPVLQTLDSDKINKYLITLRESTLDFRDLLFVNMEGVIVASSSPALIEKELSTAAPQLVDYFVKASHIKTDEVVFQGGFFNEQTKQIELHFLKPVMDNQNNAIGVLVLALNIDKIKQLVVSLEEKTPGNKPAFLVNEDGRLLFSGDNSMAVWDMLPGTLENPLLKKILQSDEDGFLIYTDDSGVEVLAGYADLKEHGINQEGDWQVFSVAPVKTILEPMYNLRDSLIITSIITLLMVLLVAFFIAKFITQPLKLVSTRINEIANSKGDLTQKISINTRDEIGDLARSFNKMIEGMKNIISLVLNTAERVSSSSQQLSSSAQQLSATTEEIAGAVQQIAKSSQSQAQQVQETSRVIDQMNVNVGDVARGSQDSADTSIQATEVAAQGGESMRSTREKMSAIYERVSSSADVIQSLGARSKQIGTIVDVITNIADQTNLLALNAAIEAARAGDAGRGFAVVADEVRKLAESSAKAADQIGKLVKEIQVETHDAVKAMQAGSSEADEGRNVALKTSQAFEDVIMIVQKTSNSIQQIATSTEQLSKGTEQIVKNIDEVAAGAEEAAAGAEQVGASTEEMAASMQQIASSSQELSQMAIVLRETVEQFKVVQRSQSKDN